MDNGTQQRGEFLNALYQQTGDDLDKHAATLDVGAAIGLQKQEASALAEELMLAELVELKTLAGGIGITRSGMEILEKEGYISGSSVTVYTLRGNPVLTDDDREITAELLDSLRTRFAEGDIAYENLEEVVFDIKTVEVQLLSPKPKTAVVRAALSCLRQSVDKLGVGPIPEKFGGVFQ